MRILDIYYVHFLTDDGEKMSIGGIETYILYLTKLAEEMGLGVRIFQFSCENFKKQYEKTAELIQLPKKKQEDIA